MVAGHGIGSCHGTAERSQEKVMVLLSVGARKLLLPPHRTLVSEVNAIFLRVSAVFSRNIEGKGLVYPASARVWPVTRRE